ncbi:MAG: lysophospholipase [Treponema sp.]|nr:lysophospholipase [Treponema sp.]
MVHNETYFETHDGTKLYLYRWSPENGNVKAVINIVHGMAEHALRYQRLAQKLTDAGIEVWAADQRGHGRTANLKINGPDRGGLLGHCADGNGYIRVTDDIRAINETIRKTINAPLFLLGHSWGSFIVQNYIEYSNPDRSENVKINGCILSGSKGPDGFIIKAGVPLMTLLAMLTGQRKGSLLAHSMADGPYTKAFKPSRTPFDWLSRDEQEVDKYINDPLCGFLCSSGFYRDLAKLLYNIHRHDAMARIDRSLPVYVFSGSADPVGDMGKSPTDLVDAYRSIGINDCDFVLYPGARHEALNETNREEVMDNLLSWINKHCE